MLWFVISLRVPSLRSQRRSTSTGLQTGHPMTSSRYDLTISFTRFFPKLRFLVMNFSSGDCLLFNCYSWVRTNQIYSEQEAQYKQRIVYKVPCKQKSAFCLRKFFSRVGTSQCLRNFARKCRICTKLLSFHTQLNILHYWENFARNILFSCLWKRAYKFNIYICFNNNFFHCQCRYSYKWIIVVKSCRF